MKCCFIVCWFGDFPKYFENWIMSVRYNPKFDFLIFTDAEYPGELPENLFFFVYSLKDFCNRAERVLGQKVSIKKAYRVCDFRPMYGVIFEKELSNYDFWGYCDIDLIFGNLTSYITEEMLREKDAVFNAGHLTLIRNSKFMNNLYTLEGAIFNYQTIIKKDAIFAFDEYTGIQRIAKANDVNAIYGIPYVDVDVRHKQVMAANYIENPKNQVFYWEDGKVYRTKLENDTVYFQNEAYIHFQKRKLERIECGYSFWIGTEGLIEKTYLGEPMRGDILRINPNLNDKEMNNEKNIYLTNKIKTIIKRNPFQIFVRVKQQIYGINKNINASRDREWYRY